MFPKERQFGCNAEPLSYFAKTRRDWVRFESDRCDLRNGVKVTLGYAKDDPDSQAQALFSFGCWFAREILPKLNGYAGHDTVKFTFE